MANTLKFGGGTWATKEGSTLAYNDENNNFKPLPFTTTRNSIATRVNKEGLIEVVGNDVPRIDYTDSEDGVLLLENSSTNLQTYSSDLSSVYVPTNITQTSNYGASPDGSLTSTRVVLANLTDSRSVETLTGTLTNGVVYTFSCYYKGVKGESTYMYFLSSAGGTNISKEIIFTGDWQRESITFTAGSASNYTYIVDVRQGSSTATDFEVWGAQVEANSFSTSYIPTNGSSMQRAADTASGAGNSQVFNDSEGVLFADIAALNNDGTTRRFSISDGSYSNRITLELDESSNTLKAFIISANTTYYSPSKVLSDITNYNKTAIKYKQNDFSLWINGFEFDVDNSGNTPINLSKMQFADGNGSDAPFRGKTKEIGYYDTALTDEELEYLTSYRSLNELVTELNLNEL